MKKYPYSLTLQAVCQAIDAYQAQESDVPEAGMIAAFEILLAASDVIPQRDALAAENAVQKSVIEGVRGVADQSNGIAGWHLNGEIARWDEILPEIDDIETPATDAYLNSVRAEGVEMFAAHHGTVADFANGDNQQSHRITEIRAKHFAAQLRAGEPS